MKVTIGIPIFERHSAHLWPIGECINRLSLPQGWDKTVFFAVNNSSQEFVDKVATLCGDLGYEYRDLGEIHEESILTLQYKDGKEKEYLGVCKDNKGYIVAVIRNEILVEAVERKADWLLFIDADSVFPQDALLQLLDLLKLFKVVDIGVLSALPVKLNTKINMPDGKRYFTPSIYYRPENNPDGETRQWLYENLHRLQYFTVDGVGFGFALIPRHVYQRFRFQPEKSGISAAQDGTYISEDFAYCLQMRDEGFKVVIHPRVECDFAETGG